MKAINTKFNETLRKLRKSKDVSQAELDKKAKLPKTTTSKLELNKREVTGEELFRIAGVLKVPMDMFYETQKIVVADDEAKLIAAIREVSFNDYKRITESLTAALYFKAKTVEKDRAKQLNKLVDEIEKLASKDTRLKGSI